MFNALKAALSYVDWYGVSIVMLNITVSGLAGILGIFSLCTLLQTKYTRNHKVLIGFIIYICYAIVYSLIVQEIFPITLVANNHIFSVPTEIWFDIAKSAIELVLYYALTVYIINKKIEIE